MLKRTLRSLNFLPLGRSSGPHNGNRLRPTSNLRPITYGTKQKDDIQYVHRADLKLQCEHCQFQWLHDTLTVRCPADKEHVQKEAWLHPMWSWGQTQPLNYSKHMPLQTNPRTGMAWAQENAKTKNNERRAQGLYRAARSRGKEQRGISRYVSGIGNYGNRWSVHFPFAS